MQVPSTTGVIMSPVTRRARHRDKLTTHKEKREHVVIEIEQWLQPAALTQALKRELHALSADEGREELSLRAFTIVWLSAAGSRIVQPDTSLLRVY